MHDDPFDTGAELRRLLAEGRISLASLTAITGIPPGTLESLTSRAPGGGSGLTSHPTHLTADATARLSDLVARLTEGAAVEDDVRLRAVLETLTLSLHLSARNIALLTGIEVDAVEAALRDPREVDGGRRYALAIRASYLLHAVGDAAPPPHRG
jgi:hypothetical protein